MVMVSGASFQLRLSFQTVNTDNKLTDPIPGPITDPMTRPMINMSKWVVQSSSHLNHHRHHHDHRHDSETWDRSVWSWHLSPPPPAVCYCFQSPGFPWHKNGINILQDIFVIMKLYALENRFPNDHISFGHKYGRRCESFKRDLFEVHPKTFRLSSTIALKIWKAHQ